MDKWILRLAERFDPEYSRLYLVSDPDRLLAVPNLQTLLRSRGWEIVRYEDPVEFRALYESGMREDVACVIVDVGELRREHVPFDVLTAGVFVPISMDEFVPRLSPAALSEVPPEDLGRVIEAAARYTGEALGEQRSREFLLREVYGVAPLALGRLEAFVEYLLRRHYSGERLPEALDRTLAIQLNQVLEVDADIYSLLRHPETFYRWLQAHWNESVKSRLDGQLRESGIPYESSPGIRVYLDNLFLDGLLQRVPVPTAEVPGWMRSGVVVPGEDPAEESWALLRQMDGGWPQSDASHRDWLGFAWRWSELGARMSLLPEACQTRRDLREAIGPVQERMEEAFWEWMLAKYAGLPSLTARSAPVMVHQVANVLRSEIEAGERVALVVMDGLALDSWLVLKDGLSGWLEGVTSRRVPPSRGCQPSPRFPGRHSSRAGYRPCSQSPCTPPRRRRSTGTGWEETGGCLLRRSGTRT